MSSITRHHVVSSSGKASESAKPVNSNTHSHWQALPRILGRVLSASVAAELSRAESRRTLGQLRAPVVRNELAGTAREHPPIRFQGLVTL